ncbi:MAG: penicillin-binding protein 2 [Proteobacteria bacterium]|nr:penicillin-binding protein 2 [Pseudomonadota bacterium]
MTATSPQSFDDADFASLAAPGSDTVALPSAASIRLRMLALGLVLVLATAAISGQLVRLAITGRADMRTASAEPIVRNYSRPDIVDRQGRLIATDVGANSLFADPGLILDRDEVAEKLARTLPGIDADELRRLLADKTRRFVWIRRGLAPVEAQRVHDLGLPGLAFRREPKRVYPQGALLGHILGQVNPDNRGLSGIERHIDETGGSDALSGSLLANAAPVRLSIDLGAQHAVAEELKSAAGHYKAKGASAVVMDANSGEIVAAASWPGIDPNVPGAHLDPDRLDRLAGGVYELGSIFKMLTIANSLDEGLATLDKSYDTVEPLIFGGRQIKDSHPLGRPLTVRDIFLHSSNVGAARMALEAGTTRQLVFLARMGLLEPIRTEAGPIAPPLLPQRWDEVETATIAFGHGLAVAPLQFIATAAAVLNGGHRVTPTFLAARPRDATSDDTVLKPTTSAAIRELMRLNVTVAYGTGRRADVPGYRVGGKTGTAEVAGIGGYQKKAVIASFLAALPMDAPRYVMMVSLFEPEAAEETHGGITAGLNAAPVTARIVERIAPILELLPRGIPSAQP